MVEILPTFLPGFQALLQDTPSGLDEMEPPVLVRDVHADLLDAYTDFHALIDETTDQLDGGEADADVLQAFFGDRSGAELDARLTDIANRLVAIAVAEGIALDLSAGALVADSDRPVRNSQPDTDVRTVTPHEPRVEPVDPLIPPGAPTGITGLDQGIDSIVSFSEDFGPMIGHLRYSSIGHTLETGIGGSPKCWEVPETPQVEGARWQAAIELSEPVGGYSSVLIDAKTEIVGADGQLGNIDTIEPGQQFEIEGTPLPWSLWRAERVTIVG